MQAIHTSHKKESSYQNIPVVLSLNETLTSARTVSLSEPKTTIVVFLYLQLQSLTSSTLTFIIISIFAHNVPLFQNLGRKWNSKSRKAWRDGAKWLLFSESPYVNWLKSPQMEISREQIFCCWPVLFLAYNGPHLLLVSFSKWNILCGLW